MVFFDHTHSPRGQRMSPHGFRSWWSQCCSEETTVFTIVGILAIVGLTIWCYAT